MISTSFVFVNTLDKKHLRLKPFSRSPLHGGGAHSQFLGGGQSPFPSSPNRASSTMNEVEIKDINDIINEIIHDEEAANAGGGVNIDRVYEELGSQAQVAVDSVGPASDNPDQDQASDVPERHPESDNPAKSKSVQSLGKSEK